MDWLSKCLSIAVQIVLIGHKAIPLVKKKMVRFSRRVFFILAVGIISWVFFLIVKNIMASKEPQPSLMRIAFPASKDFDSLKVDPARVDTIAQAHLVRNLFSRLVEFSADGSLIPSLAESFSTSEEGVEFIIRQGLQTVDGRKIGARDVAFSFKRLLALGKNTHGDLGMFLCLQEKITHPNDECSSIEVIGEVLRLRLAHPNHQQFLLRLLASVDFSIIPIGSVDVSSPGFPIVDFRNTSGVYFLGEDSPVGSYLLRANSSHFYFSNRIPKEIRFVTAKEEEAVSLLVAGELDAITTVSLRNAKLVESLRNQMKNIAVHETVPIALRAVMFTKRGQSELSTSTRLRIGAKIKQAFLKSFPDYKLQVSNEYFPQFGEGSLTDEQRLRLKGVLNSISHVSENVRAVVAVPPGESNLYKNAFGAIDEVEVVESKRAPWTLPISEQPHLFVSVIDSAFFEDFSLISYNIDNGNFGMNSDTGRQWLSRYLAEPSKNDRLTMLRELHYNLLVSGRVVPIGFSSYFSVARTPWEIGFSKYFAGSPMWLLKSN